MPTIDRSRACLLRRLRLLGALLLLLGLTLHPPAARALFNGQSASLVLGQPDFTTTHTTSAQTFMGGAGVAVDPLSGKVFVIDALDNRVLRFAAIGALTNGAAAEAVLGQPGFVSGGSGTGARGMFRPTGLAFDAQGRLWVADSDNNRVLRFDNAAGKANGAAADAVLGQAGFDTGTAGTSAQRMRTPSGLAADAQGRLWVADSGNNRVLRFDSAATKPSGAAADRVLGQPDFASSAFGLGAQRMHDPSALALDTAGRLWVVDQVNSRVLRFDNAAGKASGAAADRVLGQADFSTGASGDGAQGMRQPQGLVLDGQGRLWVADTSNRRVLRFDNAAGKASGAAADGVLGQPDFASVSCRTIAQGMCGPSDLALDAQGRLWVVDGGNRRVIWFNNAAGKTSGAAADGVLGQPDLVRDVHINARALFSPTAVAVDPTSGKLFVADMANNRVLRYASRAALSNGAGAEGVLGQPGFSTKAADTTAQRMRYPMALTVDAQGRLWVGDRDNNRVLRFDNAAGKPNGAAADGVLGKPDFTTTSGPTGGPQAFAYPTSLTTDAAGHLWVADYRNNRVLRFDNAASKPNGAAADAVLGASDLEDGRVSNNRQRLSRPYGLAVDAQGRLWVLDAGNNRVLRFDNIASKPNGAAADAVLGQPDFDTFDRHQGTATGLSSPNALAIDSQGRLWVADSANNRVVWFDNAAGKANGAAADGVLGQPDFAGFLPGLSASALNLPFGLAIDPGGQLWVADADNNRVLLFDPARTLTPRVYVPYIRRST